MKDLYLKIYLTNLGKYVEGELIGEWVDVSTDTDWNEELNKIGVKEDTDYEEYFITDYDTNIKMERYEYLSISELKKLAERIEELNNIVDSDTFNAILVSVDADFEEAYNTAVKGNYTYFDNVSDENDLGHALVDDGYYGDVNEDLKIYLDYEKIGRNYVINVNGSFSDNGFVALH